MDPGASPFKEYGTPRRFVSERKRVSRGETYGRETLGASPAAKAYSAISSMIEESSREITEEFFAKSSVFNNCWMSILLTQLSKRRLVVPDFSTSWICSKSCCSRTAEMA